MLVVRGLVARMHRSRNSGSLFSESYAHERCTMECPVCIARVENLTPPTYKGLVVACPRCGVFRIMASSVLALSALKIERRLAVLQRAKNCSSTKSWPTISGACF